ncbi:hypothetical protein POM88_053212 [Heracleum sosnowskyi]|uniref:Uncharacterized protein n=1 Tax=Heracleum sosnowskyi TaxID=360622 RepID=A0AAD8LVX5_9APIA|nr:hypothetical protein POM88_053212 [Heracleum sosnowskyi]
MKRIKKTEVVEVRRSGCVAKLSAPFIEKSSLNIPLPKQETLSRHSILGPNGLRGQWQPPTSFKGISYPSNIDLTPVEIPRLDSLPTSYICDLYLCHVVGIWEIQSLHFLRAFKGQQQATSFGKWKSVTRFALENIRLLEQLRLFQNFYEQGERETLLAEVSQLRNKVGENPLLLLPYITECWPHSGEIIFVSVWSTTLIFIFECQ